MKVIWMTMTPVVANQNKARTFVYGLSTTVVVYTNNPSDVFRSHNLYLWQIPPRSCFSSPRPYTPGMQNGWDSLPMETIHAQKQCAF